MKTLLFLALLVLLPGCGLLQRTGKVTIAGGGLMGGKSSVVAPPDAGKPGELSSEGQEASVKLPAGSVITTTKTEGQPATSTTPARPAMEVREIKLSSDSTWYERAQKIAANTGTVDTSVAKTRIAAEERRPLLYVAIGCAIGAVVLMVAKWPSVAAAAAVASALFFAAWKFSEMPPWVGLTVLVGGGAIMLGYKRAEWDANGDGIPDVLQKKTP